MSGTGFGTVVLHVSPEAAAGGNLALIRNGDLITLDVPNKSLHLQVSDEELQARRAAWEAPAPVADRGYVSMYVKHVEQPHLGADLDFLKGSSGGAVTRDSHAGYMRKRYFLPGSAGATYWLRTLGNRSMASTLECAHILKPV